MAVPATLPLQPPTAAPQAGVSGRAPGAKPGFAAAMAAAGAVTPKTMAAGTMAPLVLGKAQAGAADPGENTATIDPAGLAALLLGATVAPPIASTPAGGAVAGTPAIAAGALAQAKASGAAIATPSSIASATSGPTTTGPTTTAITTGTATAGIATGSSDAVLAMITGDGAAKAILGDPLKSGGVPGATPKPPGAPGVPIQPPAATATLSIPAPAIPIQTPPALVAPVAPVVPVASAAKPGGKAPIGGDGTGVAPRVATSIGAFPSDGNGATRPATVATSLAAAAPVVAVARVEKPASPPSPLLAGNAIVATAAVQQAASGTLAPGKRVGAVGGAGVDDAQPAANKAGPNAAPAATTLAARDPGLEPPKAAADTPTPLGDLSSTTPSARPTPPHTAGAETAHDGHAEVPRPPAEQIALHIRTAVRHGTDRISIQLHPASLGSIDITLHLRHDGQVAATVTADRADTYDLLQRDARGLERALQDAGLRTDPGGLSFNLRGDGRGAQGSPRQPIYVAPTIATNDLVPDDTLGATRRPAANLDRALDIHV